VTSLGRTGRVCFGNSGFFLCSRLRRNAIAASRVEASSIKGRGTGASASREAGLTAFSGIRLRCDFIAANLRTLPVSFKVVVDAMAEPRPLEGMFRTLMLTGRAMRGKEGGLDEAFMGVAAGFSGAFGRVALRRSFSLAFAAR